MTDFEFKKFIPTPGEKNLGIATVKCWGKITIRYKVMPNKEGVGFYILPASYKMPACQGEAEYYDQAWIIESNSDKEEIESLIKRTVKSLIAQQTPQQPAASYSQQNSYVSPQNHYQPQQAYQQPQHQPHLQMEQNLFGNQNPPF